MSTDTQPSCLEADARGDESSVRLRRGSCHEPVMKFVQPEGMTRAWRRSGWKMDQVSTLGRSSSSASLSTPSAELRSWERSC